MGVLRFAIQAVALSGVALASSGSASPDARLTVPPGVEAQAEREGSVRVIVRIDAPIAATRRAGAGRARARDAIREAGDHVLARAGRPAVLRRYGGLPLLALEVSSRELRELARSDSVLAIEPDRLLRPSLGQSVPHVAAEVSADAGFDGEGVAIVVIDTGVESGHPFFGGRVSAEACFSGGRDCPNGQKTQFGPGSAAPCDYGSLCWHGTHVAGIAAGSTTLIQGVAPAASIIAIQIGTEVSSPAECGTAGAPCVLLYQSDAIAALDYVADTLSETFDIAAVNLSFGSSGTWSSEVACDASNPGYKVAFDALQALGIAAVAAAGNASVTTGINSPACLSNAIGVGATFDQWDTVWASSNSGPPLDLLAPGTNITSSGIGGGYEGHSGTSMASPHVTGALAALRQASPGLSVADAREALTSSGVPVLDTRNGLTFPRIQVDDAVRSLGPSACFDALDNDGDGFVDVDGDGGAPDPQCVDGFDTNEGSPTVGCGVGPELALVLPLLGALRRRRGRA